MEGLVALSLAANIFQVIDFSQQILSAALEVYRHGVVSDHATLDLIAQDLQNANGSLLTTLNSHSGQHPATNNGAITDLAVKSNEIAKTLLLQLKQTNSSSKVRTFQSICSGIKAIWNKDKILETLTRLQGLRDAIEYRIIISLRASADQQVDLLNDLDSRTSAVLAAVIDSKADYQNELKEQTLVLARQADLSDRAAEARHVEVLNAIRSLSINTNLPSNSILQASPQQTSSPRTFPTIKLLEWLRFPQITARRDAISEAHQNTFEWIYSDTTTAGRKPTGFPGWARNSGGIYWIKGKAGSGKSTLMKFIADDPRTLQMLQEWAGGQDLLFCSFYFWNPGNSMQKSAVGLLRSLLHDILRARPELASVAFPDWLEKFSTQEPIFEEVASALIRLLKFEDSRRKMCFFIDGLDEYEGDSIEQTELCKLIINMAQATGVKALVSSRPLRPFEESLKAWPSIMLQDLTAGDMLRLVEDKLDNHPGMAELQRQHPEESKTLVFEITDKASGVFLWVRLAVNLILDGLQNHDDLAEMYRRLAEIPPELEDLFSYMLKRIPMRYKSQACRLLQIMLRSQDVPLSEVTVATMSFAGRVDEHAALKLQSIPYTTAEVASLVKDLDIKLKSRCLGLLEIRELPILDDSGNSSDSSHYVDYLHRSVPEYLRGSTEWISLLQGNWSDAEVDYAILEGLLAHLKIANQDPFLYLDQFLRQIQHTECSTGTAQTGILREFDITMSKRLSKEIQEFEPSPGDRQPLQHWTELITEELFAHSRRSSLVALLVSYNCKLSVEQHLTESSHRPQQKTGRPPLENALLCVTFQKSDAFMTRNRYVYPQMVDLLLQIGGDPNLEFEGRSVWSKALYELTLENHYPCEPRHQVDLLGVFGMLLNYGADPHAKCNINQGGREGELQEPIYRSAPEVLRLFLEHTCLCYTRKASESYGSGENTSEASPTYLSCSCETSANVRSQITELLETLERLGAGASDRPDNVASSTSNSPAPTQSGLSNEIVSERRHDSVENWFSRALRKKKKVG